MDRLADFLQVEVKTEADDEDEGEDETDCLPAPELDTTAHLSRYKYFPWGCNIF